MRERDRLEGPDVDKRIKLRWIFKKWSRVMDWINLALDRDRWWALVSTV